MLTYDKPPDATKLRAARVKIRSRYGTALGKDDVDLFVSHHLEELSEDEWRSVGKEIPTSHDILDALVLRSVWGDEESEATETYDFTLPNEMTQYVIAVKFEGETIVDIDMES